MKTPVIELKELSKSYNNFKKPTSLIETLFERNKVSDFWALKKVNLKINKGEKIGIIGPNGAGKTTLLSILAGITTPNKGSAKIEGKVTSVIELEAGFHPELTGIENIYLNGMILGMKKELIKNRMDEIVKFADIGKFIEQPMFTYSEGMKLRVAFSVAAFSDFDILVLDENISVGDREFQQKSLQKIREFFARGKTVIIATHYLDFIVKTCTRVIWLEKGKVKMDGTSKKIIAHYERSNIT